MDKKVIYTLRNRDDGFGGQYQGIIYAMLYAWNLNHDFIYKPLKSVEHNYDNDSKFIDKLEDLMNIKNCIINLNNINKDEYEIIEYNITNEYKEIDSNFEKYINCEKIKEIKEIFWKNKDKDYFKNNKINVAVHIRRPNPHDNRKEGTDTHVGYYLKIINQIKKEYNNNDLVFHIYSQGKKDNFCESNLDLVFHLDEDITETFKGMVAADILVMSKSSLSYTAAILSDGIIYYQPFWHPKASKWKSF